MTTIPELAEARTQFRDTLKLFRDPDLPSPRHDDRPRPNWLMAMNPDEYIGRGRVLEEQK